MIHITMSNEYISNISLQEMFLTMLSTPFCIRNATH